MSEEAPTTRPVAPQHAFDLARLDAWMRQHLPAHDGGLEVAQFKGGQSNPTYLVSAARQALRAASQAAAASCCSRRTPSSREYRVISALAGTAVPVARAYALCEDESVIGTPFYMMDYVAGRVMRDPQLPGMTPAEAGRNPW